VSDFTFSEHLMILGVDPSVRKTACVLRAVGGATWHDLLVKTGPQLADPGRLVHIGETVRRFVASCATREWEDAGSELLLCIESPATQAGYAHVNQALHWFIRAWLAMYYDTHTLVVAPSALRKFIVGNGRAEKGTCGCAAYRHWPEIIDGFTNGGQEDVLDALGLAELAQCWLWDGDGHYLQYQLEVAQMQNAQKRRIAIRDGVSLDIALRNVGTEPASRIAGIAPGRRSL